VLTERGLLTAITAGTLVILGRRRWGANGFVLALFDPVWLLGERAGCSFAVGSVSVVVPGRGAVAISHRSLRVWAGMWYHVRCAVHRVALLGALW
jgi:hypothetical protein